MRNGADRRRWNNIRIKRGRHVMSMERSIPRKDQPLTLPLSACSDAATIFFRSQDDLEMAKNQIGKPLARVYLRQMLRWIYEPQVWEISLLRLTATPRGDSVGFGFWADSCKCRQNNNIYTLIKVRLST